jgi:hypothetical protein
MLIFDNVIIPDNLFEEKFSCDLTFCKGVCCIEGDAGAPLSEMEIDVLENIIDVVKPFMTPKGVEIIEKNGVFDFDIEGCFATPLIDEKECAFCIDDNGTTRCAIEKAYEAGALKGLSDDNEFNKPISCHLYPIRLVTKENGFIELKYHKWDVCYCARKNGKQQQISLFEFLKQPLVRRFGDEWFEAVKRRRYKI